MVPPSITSKSALKEILANCCQQHKAFWNLLALETIFQDAKTQTFLVANVARGGSDNNGKVATFLKIFKAVASPVSLRQVLCLFLAGEKIRQYSVPQGPAALVLMALASADDVAVATSEGEEAIQRWLVGTLQYVDIQSKEPPAVFPWYEIEGSSDPQHTDAPQTNESYLLSRGFLIKGKRRGKYATTEVIKALKEAEKKICEGKTVRNRLTGQGVPPNRSYRLVICDGCNGYMGLKSGFYTCTQCEVDFCTTCVKVHEHKHPLLFVISDCTPQSGLHYTLTLAFLKKGVTPCGTQVKQAASSDRLPDKNLSWSCNICNSWILTERFSCPTCGDFDMCFKCMRSTFHPHVIVHEGSVGPRPSTSGIVKEEVRCKEEEDGVNVAVDPMSRISSASAPATYVCRVDLMEREELEWVLRNRCTGVIAARTPTKGSEEGGLVVIVSLRALFKGCDQQDLEISRVFVAFPHRPHNKGGVDWLDTEMPGTEVTHQCVGYSPTVGSLIFQLPLTLPQGLRPIAPPASVAYPALLEEMQCTHFPDWRMTPVTRTLTVCDSHSSKRQALGPLWRKRPWQSLLSESREGDGFFSTAEPMAEVGSMGAPLLNSRTGVWVGVAAGSPSLNGVGLHIPVTVFLRYLKEEAHFSLDGYKDYMTIVKEENAADMTAKSSIAKRHYTSFETLNLKEALSNL